MALLSLPFLVGSTRSVPVGQRITVGGTGIGITYYLAQQISGSPSRDSALECSTDRHDPGLIILGEALVLLACANLKHQLKRTKGRADGVRVHWDS